MKRTPLAAGLALSLAGLLTIPSLSAGADQTISATSASAGAPSVRPESETLRFGCTAHVTDRDRPAVGCRWSPTQSDGAAGYRVVRSGGSQRSVVYASRDLTQTWFVDREVRPGATYTYHLSVLNRAGRTIGEARPVTVEIGRPAETEVLSMACRVRPADSPLVGCRWRPATTDTAVGYQLWRLVDEGERELVHRGGLDTTTYFDDDLAGASAVRYAVLAIDEDGEIVGRSLPQPVRLHHAD